MKKIFSVLLVLFLLAGCNNKAKEKEVVDTSKSSLVSEGVKVNDLGNVLNGQFYFVDGNNQYYSTFDNNGNPHIYIKNNSNGEVKTIFDGFGWSFVVHDGWLYFSGNSGTRIDATYTLYRCKTDGSSLEHLIDKYTVNMNFYKEWLYYTRKDDYNSKVSSIYRSSLDGSNEKEIVSDVNNSGLSVIYNDKLYYFDSNSIMYRSNADGTNPQAIITDKVDYFVIGTGKIIYLDQNNNLKICNEDGSNNKTIRATTGVDILKINSSKNIVTYITYEAFDQAKYSYPYSIHSINIDGTNDQKIYDSTSYGFYINLLNNKIYVLDYFYEANYSKQIAITRSLNLDGTNIEDLAR